MVNPLDGVLHVRYMLPDTSLGTNNYGGQDAGSFCSIGDYGAGDPSRYSKFEGSTTSNTADVSRGTFNYFDGSIWLRGAPSGLGGMGGTVESSNINKQAVNRAVSFMGITYALIGDKIYRYDESEPDKNNRWKTEITLTGKDGSATTSLGLYPVFKGGKPTLVTAWNVSGGGNWRYAELDGTSDTWTISSTISVPAGTPSDSNGGVFTECQYAGRIYFLMDVADVNNHIFWYDYVAGTLNSIVWPTTVRFPMDFCVFMGDLFVINKDNTGNIKLWRVGETGGEITPVEVASYQRQTGGVWGDAFETLTTSNQYEGRPLMFVDNVYDSQVNAKTPVLYTAYVCHAAAASPILSTDSSHGLHHVPFRSDGNGGLTSQETAGQALGFRANPFKANHNQEGAYSPGPYFWPVRWPSRKDERIVLRTFVDQKTRDSDLSGKTAIVISSRWRGQGCGGADGGGGEYTNQFYHEFVGSGNAGGDAGMPDLPTNGGQAHSMKLLGFPAKNTRHRAAVHERIGGGARHHVTDSNDNRIADIVFKGVDTTDEDGVIRIKYSILPSVATPSGTLVTVRWFHDVNYHAPETPCTLTGTSEGSISGVYSAKDIEVKDSSHIYYVDWQAQGDGVTRGNRLLLNGMLILSTSPDFITSPSGLPGLVSWYDASDYSTITTGAGDAVESWQDKGPGLPGIPASGVEQLTAANQPTLVSSGVVFDSTNSEFLIAPTGSIINSNDPSTIFVVYRPSSLSSTDTFLSISEDVSSSGSVSREYMNMSVVDSADDDLLIESQDFLREQTAQGARTLTLASGGEIDKTRLAIWTENAFEGYGEVYPSGDTGLTDITVDYEVESSNLSNLTMGRYSGVQVSGVYNNAGQYFDGTIYEVVTYNRVLNASEIQLFKDYIDGKYTLDA